MPRLENFTQEEEFRSDAQRFTNCAMRSYTSEMGKNKAINLVHCIIGLPLSFTIATLSYTILFFTMVFTVATVSQYWKV